jgi:thioredoxin reductase
MHTVASRDHFNPREFGLIAREQIESRYDSVWFQSATITHASSKQLSLPDEKDLYDGFEVKDSEGHSYAGKKVILATGSKDILPNLPGYKENWPAHIYQCLACDGYEQRGSAVGILDFDHPMYAHMTQMAVPLEPTSITIFSNGSIKKEAPIQDALKMAKVFGATLDERKIVRLVNNGPSHTDGVTIHFECGEPVTLGFLVHKPATVNRAQHLIEQLGIETVDPAIGGHIKIANATFNETSVRGVFAGGDTMVMMKQVAISMADGLRACMGAGMQIAQEKAKTLSKAFEEREGTIEGENDKAEVASY